MPILVQLSAAGPHLLKYLLTTSVVSEGASPLLALTLGNDANAATPDLRTDALTGRTNGAGGLTPLLAIMRVRVDGYLPWALAAGALTQAQARALLLANEASAAAAAAAPHNDGHAVSAEAFITPRGVQGPTTWAVDASVDASGDPVLVVRTRKHVGPFTGAGNSVNRFAVLTIRCRHTINL